MMNCYIIHLLPNILMNGKEKPNEWLSSEDILNVMHQYEKKI